MQTYIYLVRHAESPFRVNAEETRGLSEKGWRDAERVADILQAEGIDAFVSSSYQRAIQTVQPAAQRMGKPIAIDARFRERELAHPEMVFADFLQAVERLYADPAYAHPGGESNSAARERGVAALLDLLAAHRGQRVAVGTHGNIMTLIMSHFDDRYDFTFWKQTTQPDVYRLTFDEDALTGVTRLWEE